MEGMLTIANPSQISRPLQEHSSAASSGGNINKKLISVSCSEGQCSESQLTHPSSGPLCLFFFFFHSGAIIYLTLE